MSDPALPSGFAASRERAWEAILSREPTMTLDVVRHDIGVDTGFDDLAEERARESRLMAIIFGKGKPGKAGKLPETPPPPPPVEDHIDEITRTTLAFVNRLFAGISPGRGTAGGRPASEWKRSAAIRIPTGRRYGRRRPGLPRPRCGFCGRRPCSGSPPWRRRIGWWLLAWISGTWATRG